MRFAAFQHDDSVLSQRELVAAISVLRERGMHIVGVIEDRSATAMEVCRVGTLRSLTTPAKYDMFLDAPPADTSCRLDAMGVDAACSDLIDQIPSADLVVLSKFGKLEAEQHGGLVPAFLEAATAGKPVLTTVSAKHRATWQQFAPGAKVLLTADDAIGWLRHPHG